MSFHSLLNFNLLFLNQKQNIVLLTVFDCDVVHFLSLSYFFACIKICQVIFLPESELEAQWSSCLMLQLSYVKCLQNLLSRKENRGNRNIFFPGCFFPLCSSPFMIILPMQLDFCWKVNQKQRINMSCPKTSVRNEHIRTPECRNTFDKKDENILLRLLSISSQVIRFSRTRV